MDASSSSFLSVNQTSKLLAGTSMAMAIPKSAVTATPSFLSRRRPPPLNVSSARIEEKSRNSTTRSPATSRTSRPGSTTTTLPAATNSSAQSTRKYPANDRRVAEPNLQPIMIFNVLEDVINNFIDPPLRPSVDPRYVLSDNFAPVDELPPTECEVIHGSLPSCLDGAYIRNGPNPQFLPRGPYHLFDGDGMLC